jgi:hypothetical protein
MSINRRPPLLVSALLLLFGLSQQLVFRRVSFTLFNMLQSYGSSCSVFSLTKQSSLFTPAVALLLFLGPRLRIVVPFMALLHFEAGLHS